MLAAQVTDDTEDSAPPSGAPDSFDALLKRVAHVSDPVLAPPGFIVRPGTSLLGGRLQVQRHIGEGGMGVVVAAFDEQRRATVALKTLHRLDAGNVYRLKNEFRSLADVHHPNLCRLHELFGDANTWFFTMELVDGERFDEYVRREGTLDEARLRAVLPQLLDGLEAIHAAGQLHRDLKPSNVLVARDGRVVILDFGLAMDSELGGVGQTVLETGVSGTPAYMAPEQAAGQGVSQASDYYAVGTMLFEALTDKLPFDGRAHEILVDKQRHDAPSASSISYAVPQDLDALCADLLSRDPTRRPRATEIRQRLGVDVASSPRPAQKGTATSDGQAAVELLGREGELKSLRDAFAQTLAGQATVLWVAGESGMGKSALVHAFLDELRERGDTVVLTGRCYERENVPFKALDAVVDEISRHLRRLPPIEAAAVLPREMFALARLFPVLDRVSVVAEAPRKHVPDPNDVMRRAFLAFGELMGRMRDRSPLVVFIDDLQWMDQDSVRFMRALFVQADPAPLLLIAAHRSEDVATNELLASVKQAAADNQALRAETLAVGPLRASTMLVLARKLLPHGDEPVVSEQFAVESRGNPFFAQELARAASLGTFKHALPSLTEALALHVASMSDAAQKFLRLLALAGQPLRPQVVIDAASIGGGHDVFDLLLSEQLIRVSHKGGHRLVECYHDKIREHTVSGLDTLQTKELSLGLSRALLALPELDHELLAHCLDLADEVQEAAEHAVLAADEARKALASTRAAVLYTRAIERGRFDPARTQALRIAKAEALGASGQGERAGQAYLEAVVYAQPAAVRDLTMKAAEQFLMCGNLERGRELLGEALRHVGHSVPRSLPGALASLAWSRARVKLQGLDFTAREHWDDATLRELEALQVTAHALSHSDQLRAADFFARWLVAALRAGHRGHIGRSLSWEILNATSLNSGSEYVERTIALCRRLEAETGDRQMAQWSLQALAMRAQMLGDPATTLRTYDSLLVLINAHPMATASYDMAWIQSFRSFALFFLAKVSEARDMAEATRSDAIARGDATVTSPLGQVAMYCALAGDRPEHAERLVREEARHLRPGHYTLQDLFMGLVQYFPALYRGEALAAWCEYEAYYDGYFASFQGRLFSGPAYRNVAGFALCAAREASDPAEGERIRKKALRLAKKAAAAGEKVPFGSAEALIRCIHGDREGATHAMRAFLETDPPPLYLHMGRRCLGALLSGAEGAATIAQADAALRSAGVVDPARFTRIFMPGIELP